MSDDLFRCASPGADLGNGGEVLLQRKDTVTQTKLANEGVSSLPWGEFK